LRSRFGCFGDDGSGLRRGARAARSVAPLGGFQLPMIHSIYRLIFKIWRPRRHQKFLRIMKPCMGETLLDVGGAPWCWAEHEPFVGRIDLVNTHTLDWPKENKSRHQIRMMAGDGCALPFAEGSYEIAHSNSVIEHVGNIEKQAAFATEIRRVGERVWVQTPAWEFPIEPHYLAPGVHWLPKSWRPWVVRWLTPRGWIERQPAADLKTEVDSTRLLSRREMQRLFPDCEILTERVLGWPKAHIAVRSASTPGQLSCRPEWARSTAPDRPTVSEMK